MSNALFSDNTIDVIRRFFSQTLSLDSGESSEKNDIVLDKVGSIHMFTKMLHTPKRLKHPNVIIGYSWIDLRGSTGALAGAWLQEHCDNGGSWHIHMWVRHKYARLWAWILRTILTFSAAGIPDFRSPGSGLYNNLKKYKLPHPTAIFDIDYFQKNPTPFFALAKELYPGSFTPTPAHYFVRLLHEKGLLVRHYTQNIDTLDRLAGLPDDKIIEAHGSFHTNHCIKCNKEYDMAWMKEQIFSDQLPACEECEGIVKPDIVFFGENLPVSFYSSPEEDFKECDLLIIMGTSLEVQPFASLIQRPGPRCVRLLINRDAVGRSSFAPWMEYNERSLLYGKPRNVRDVAYLGNCDAGVWEIAEALGWNEELQQLIDNDKEQTNLDDDAKVAALPASKQ